MWHDHAPQVEAFVDKKKRLEGNTAKVCSSDSKIHTIVSWSGHQVLQTQNPPGVPQAQADMDPVEQYKAQHKVTAVHNARAYPFRGAGM